MARGSARVGTQTQPLWPTPLAEAWSGLGLSLAAPGRFDEAFCAYARALAANPDSIHAYINWGNGLASQERFAAAIEKYELALKLQAGDALRSKCSRA